jgi:DNA-directed RNA polymerase specialized sigma24 family protein
MRFTDEEVKQLLRRALDNDEAAWKALFEGLYGLMRSQGVRAGLTGDDLDDSVGDILHSLVATPGEFLEARDTLSYLSASSYFAALRVRKARNRLAARESSMHDNSDGNDGRPAREPRRAAQQVKIILSNQVARAVEAAFDAVPDPARRYALLHYRADLSYEEVAYVCGGTAGAIRVAVHRALTRALGALNSTLGEELDRGSFRHALRELEMPDQLRPQVTPESRRVIERWVTARESLSPAERAEAEEVLADDQESRLLLVLLERQSYAELDVRGHSLPESIPAVLLENLLAETRKQQGRLEDE